MKYCIANFCDCGWEGTKCTIELAKQLCGDGDYYDANEDDSYKGDPKRIYINRFNTEAERDAYILGLEQTDGFSRYECQTWEEGGLENVQYDAWALSADDLTDRYDCSNLSDEEIDKILVKIYETMIKNDAMSECFWYCIDYIAELKGLERID